MNQQAKQHLHSDDWQRTVYINTLDVGATDFKLSDKKNRPWSSRASTAPRPSASGSRAEANNRSTA